MSDDAEDCISGIRLTPALSCGAHRRRRAAGSSAMLARRHKFSSRPTETIVLHRRCAQLPWLELRGGHRLGLTRHTRTRQIENEADTNRDAYKTQLVP